MDRGAGRRDVSTPLTRTAPYSALAEVYDRWMAADRVPYEEWLAFITRRFAEAPRQVRRVLDLCCGTGTTIRGLQDAGYEVAGVDASPQMLDVARSRARPGTRLLRIRLPDERLLRLGRFDATLMCFDSANYLSGPGDLAAVLRHVAALLNPGGVLVFDLSTRLSFEAIAARGEFDEELDDFSYRWSTRSRPGTEHYEFEVTLTVPGRRATEVHHQRWFARDEVEQELAAAGFTAVSVHDNYTDAPWNPATRRDTWSARSAVDCRGEATP